MKVTIGISAENLLNECIHQSLIDVQVVRTEHGASVVDNVAMSQNNADIFYTELDSQLSRLYTWFTDQIQYTFTDDDLSIVIECPDESLNNSYRTALATTIKDVLKCGMLAWWNLSRNPNLSLQYTAKQDDLRSNILHMLFIKMERPYSLY